MNHTLKRLVLLMCAIGAMLTAAGCEALQPGGRHLLWLESHGVGGGGNN
jgi:hypothetical protein